MTFSVNVPNSSQSPGIFPAQCNVNFQRLLDIINNDHNFTNSSSLAQGIHKQCTFINRSVPVGLTAGNAILFTAPDANGSTQLNFYNGVNNIQLTPYETLLPIRVVGSQNNVPNNGTVTIFPDPGFRYCGTGWGIITGTVLFNFYNLIRSGPNDLHILDNNGDFAPPVFLFSSNNLILKNTSGGTLNVTWSLIINRIS